MRCRSGLAMVRPLALLAISALFSAAMARFTPPLRPSPSPLLVVACTLLCTFSMSLYCFLLKVRPLLVLAARTCFIAPPTALSVWVVAPPRCASRTVTDCSCIIRCRSRLAMARPADRFAILS